MLQQETHRSSRLPARTRVASDQESPARAFVSSQSLASSLGTAIIYGVPDNAWAPIFRKGEFVVADLDNRHLEEGEFLLRRSSCSGNIHIVRPRLHRKEQGKIIGARAEPSWVNDPMMPSRGHWDGQFWWIQFGQQPLYPLVGAPVQYYSSADGPMPDKLLREECVGRIIGIAGERQ